MALPVNEASILPAVQKSPFWRRTYGGYTLNQVRFVRTHLGATTGKRVYDPMAGQAHALAPLAWEGTIVHLSDHNPAPLCLAYLRHPAILRESFQLAQELKVKLTKLKKSEKKPAPPEYFDDWVSPPVLASLRRTFRYLGVSLAQSPFEPSETFWLQSSAEVLPVALAVLAARAITCFRSTDNTTWMRKGGVTSRWKVTDALLQALQNWADFAAKATRNFAGGGDLRLATWDASSISRWPKNLMDAIVVSPPYANRLDYTSLWSPELAVLVSLFDADPQHLKANQMGTTVVSKRFPSDDDVAKLPQSTIDKLESIRLDPTKFSDIYYYPFFANYAIGLRQAVINWAKSIRKRGKLLVFIRNTVRKDHLFRADDLVKATATETGLTPLSGGDATHIIRAHVGLLRSRRSRPGVHGSAQIERWLAFQKS